MNSTIKIRSTLERGASPKPFVPMDPNGKTVNMFICGPTVYDYIHIGNGRTFVIFDVIAKWLRYRGYHLNYIQNITDIDDKIIKRGKDKGKDPKDIAGEFEMAFLDDMKSIDVNSVSHYARASEYVDNIIAQIETLIKKGYAYAAPSVFLDEPEAVNSAYNQDVYFSVAKFRDYGKLSGQSSDDTEAGARAEVEKNKRDHRDFVLWKAQNYAYEPTWKSPWGMGRPGWHIEDTAISEKFFGPQYDIHGAGQDLIFPHHEAEIAQQESASGKKPLVRYWLHAGLLVDRGEKMAKSVGNFVIVRDLLKEYPKEAIRFFFLSAHYRAPLDYSERNLKSAQAAVNRLGEFYQKLKNLNGNKAGDGFKKKTKQIEYTLHAANAERAFEDDMDNDFNVPAAIGWLFNMIKLLNPPISIRTIDGNLAKTIIAFLNKINEVLGIIPSQIVEIPENIQSLVNLRESARNLKDFTGADELREKINGAGYQIDDTPYGPLTKRTK